MKRDLIEKYLQEGVTLADFTAHWCAPCRAQRPTIKKLQQLYAGRANIIEISIDQHQELATRNMVQSIPTLLLFMDGKEMKRFVGLQTAITLTKAIDELVE